MATPSVVDTGEEQIASERPRRLCVEFRGSASEYLRIWIAHLCLSVLTLGLYWPWAKVRMKQYFFEHTLIDGEAFRFDAPPLAILVGRLAAACLFLGSYLLSAYAWRLSWEPTLLLLLVLPWVLVQSKRFEARYTAYRNLRFRFSGSYAGALGALLGAAILACTLVGLPWAYRRMQAYVIRQWSYGGVRARLRLSARRLLFPALFAVFIWVSGAACALVLFVWGVRGREVTPDWVLPGVVIPAYVGHVLAVSVLQAGAGNLVWRGTRLGPLRFESTVRARHLAVLYLVNALAVLASFGLLIPWAAVRLARYRASHFRATLEGEWIHFSDTAPAPVGAVGSELAESLNLELPVGP